MSPDVTGQINTKTIQNPRHLCTVQVFAQADTWVRHEAKWWVQLWFQLELYNSCNELQRVTTSFNELQVEESCKILKFWRNWHARCLFEDHAVQLVSAHCRSLNVSGSCFRHDSMHQKKCSAHLVNRAESSWAFHRSSWKALLHLFEASTAASSSRRNAGPTNQIKLI